jgi:hypothetical protein
MKQMQVVLREFANELDAELVKGHLKSAGIESMIVKDDAGSMIPSLQETEGVRLLVSREDEAEARRVLEEKAS